MAISHRGWSGIDSCSEKCNFSKIWLYFLGKWHSAAMRQQLVKLQRFCDKVLYWKSPIKILFRGEARGSRLEGGGIPAALACHSPPSASLKDTPTTTPSDQYKWLYLAKTKTNIHKSRMIWRLGEWGNASLCWLSKKQWMPFRIMLLSANIWLNNAVSYSVTAFLNTFTRELTSF